MERKVPTVISFGRHCHIQLYALLLPCRNIYNMVSRKTSNPHTLCSALLPSNNLLHLLQVSVILPNSSGLVFLLYPLYPETSFLPSMTQWDTPTECNQMRNLHPFPSLFIWMPPVTPPFWLPAAFPILPSIIPYNYLLPQKNPHVIILLFSSISDS